MTNAVATTPGVENGHKYEYKWIPVRLLKVDQYYQRFVTQARIDRIVANWNYDLVNPPKVSLRDDGSYYIIDGQHTAVAYKIHEGEDSMIYCKVFRGLTWQEEVELFLQQTGISKPLTATEKLRTRYNNNDPQVRGMVRDCGLCGVTVEFASPGTGNHRGAKCKCMAVSTLYDSYVAMPRDLFLRMMDTILKSWSGEPDSLTAGFIGGLSALYMSYGKDFEDTEMVRSLSRFSPSYYIREAKELSGRLKNRYCTIFMRVYNNKRTTRRIGAV